MKPSDLDRAFPPTPRVFSNRVDTALRALKEDEPMKKFTLRTAALVAACMVLFCGAALAVMLIQGQEWYFGNRFTAYQENDPKKHQDILSSITTDVPQAPSQDARQLVDVTVQDYAWVPSRSLLTVSFAARPRDEGRYELHPLMGMDADGLWAASPDPENEEDRAEHWLYTEKGFGLPKDVMDDPSKILLLADMNGQNLVIGDSDIPLYTSQSDSFTGEGGAVITVLEIDLGQLTAPAQSGGEAASPESPAYAAMEQYTDGQGMLTLRLPYQIVPFENGDFGTASYGIAVFQVKVR